MKLKYFQDTDTLYIELSNQEVCESKDLDGNTILDLDSGGNVLAITLEHASQRTDIASLKVEGLAA